MSSQHFDKDGRVAWLYGLSASGKTTLAFALRNHLLGEGKRSCVLDGDELRNWLSADLGFSEADREENIRRAASLAAHLADQGWQVIASLVTPLRRFRMMARELIGASRFTEVFVRCPAGDCAKRDRKGLYARFAQGQISGVAGLDAPFEPPMGGDGAFIVDSSRLSVEDMLVAVWSHLRDTASASYLISSTLPLTSNHASSAS